MSMWIAALFCVAWLASAQDYYDILGVGQDADASTIKRAFRKLSVKYHPDKNPGDDEAAQKFLELNDAYEVLSDEDKRQVYDMDGHEGLERLKKGQGRGNNNPFGMLFGGGGGGGVRRGQDYRTAYKVSLNELYNGADKTMTISRNVICRGCRGTGAHDGKVKKCKTCKGKGQTTQLKKLGPGFNVQMQVNCDKCGGKGKVPTRQCSKCQGKKVVAEEKTLEIFIEKGMAEGQELRFARASEQSPDTTPGDVVLVLKTSPHYLFKRQGNDLHMEMQLTLKEALLGFTKTFTHLDGRQVKVSSKKVTRPDHVKTLKGEGMPVHEFPSEKGNLYIKYKIKFPKQLTEEQKTAIDSTL